MRLAFTLVSTLLATSVFAVDRNTSAQTHTFKWSVAGWRTLGNRFTKSSPFRYSINRSEVIRRSSDWMNIEGSYEIVDLSHRTVHTLPRSWWLGPGIQLVARHTAVGKPKEVSLLDVAGVSGPGWEVPCAPGESIDPSPLDLTFLAGTATKSFFRLEPDEVHENGNTISKTWRNFDRSNQFRNKYAGNHLTWTLGRDISDDLPTYAVTKTEAFRSRTYEVLETRVVDGVRWPSRIRRRLYGEWKTPNVVTEEVVFDLKSVEPTSGKVYPDIPLRTWVADNRTNQFDVGPNLWPGDKEPVTYRWTGEIPVSEHLASFVRAEVKGGSFPWEVTLPPAFLLLIGGLAWKRATS